MPKNTKNKRNYKLKRCFLPFFFVQELEGVPKNILLKALGSDALNGTIQGEFTHKERTKKHLEQLKRLKNKDGDTIFKSINCIKGRIRFTLNNWVHDQSKKTRQYAIVPITEFRKIRSKNVKSLYLRMLFQRHSFNLKVTPQEITKYFGYRKLKNIRRNIVKPFLRLIKTHTSFQIKNYSFRSGLLSVSFKLFYDSVCFIGKKQREAFVILTEKYKQEAYMANKAIAHLSIDALHRLDMKLEKKTSKKLLDHIKAYAFVSLENAIHKTLLRR